MTVTTRIPASGSTNEARSGRSGTGAGDCVNTDKLIAGATIRGRATAQATAATAEAATAGSTSNAASRPRCPFASPIAASRAKRQLKQDHDQSEGGGVPDSQGEQDERALLQRCPGQFLQGGGPAGD